MKIGYLALDMLMQERQSIRLSDPDIQEEDIQIVNEVLRSGKLIQGEYVARLEESFSHYHNTSYAIAVSSGTAALHLALKTLGIQAGDEVIVPAFSFIATANSIELTGARPVFVDIDTNTFNIDAGLLQKNITAQTKAILPVHEFGLACDIETICGLAERNGLPVIEDAACSLGAKQNNRYTGTFGLMGCFSLHPRKSITSGEGGMVLTSNKEIATQLFQLRNHGISMESGKIEFVDAGYNYRLTNFQGALAWSQFNRIENILEYKNNLASIYLNAIKNEKIILPKAPSDRNHTWQTFHVVLHDSLDQQQVIERLRSQGIETKIGAQCLPDQVYFKKKYKLNAAEQFPNAWKAYTKGLALPLHAKLTSKDIMTVSKILNTL